MNGRLGQWLPNRRAHRCARSAAVVGRSVSSHLSSDPHAWLRAYYAALRTRPACATFAPSTQFQELIEAVEREHPSKAATLREWSFAAQHGLLLHLASMHEQGETADPFP